MTIDETCRDAAYSFELVLPTRVRFGIGTRTWIHDIVAREAWRRLGVVVDHNVADTAAVQELLGRLEEASQDAVIERCRIREPTYDSLEEVRPAFSGRRLDAIIGIGGGSALDMAKTMAVLVKNDGPAISYRGFDRAPNPALPIIAVPTTAGSGSEATPNASFVDQRDKVKLGINGEAVRPRYAVLDPALTLTCPRGPTLSAGVDSLVHATEAFVAKKSNALARTFAKEGFRRVFDSLPRVLDQPNDIGLRTRVMYGAFMSGVALTHWGTGPAAAMSYPLGVRHGVPHGIAGAIFLPHVVQYNVRNGIYDYASLLDGATADQAGAEATRAGRFVERLFGTWTSVGVPPTLHDVSPAVSADV